MNNCAEIERLLQMTGRTLEGLPKLYSSPEAEAAITVVGDTRIQTGNMLLHQSDVIVLLVGALRDALDKPMQKPLTLEEAWEKSKQVCDNVVWLEFKEENKSYLDVIPALISNTAPWPFGEKNLPTIRYFRFLLWPKDIIEVNKEKYGKKHRCWASRPTDEEREAAAWEN
jgi:hypothetical protein